MKHLSSLAALVTLAACMPTYDVPLPAVKASADEALVARGKYLFYGPSHCIACHAAPGVKGDALATALPVGGQEFKAGPFGTFWASNLTSCETSGLGRRSDGEIARVLRDAVAHDGGLSPFMRVAMGPLADEDVEAMVAFLRSLPAQRNEVPPSEVGLVGQLLVASGTMGPREPAPEVASAPPVGPTVERGRYLAHGPAWCVSCHSVLDPANGFAPEGAPFSGGPTEPSKGNPDVLHTAPNLTPDPETGITGRWDEEAWVARFGAGELQPGSKMPWDAYKTMSPDDARAIYRYLKTLPPTRNDIGPSVRAAD